MKKCMLVAMLMVAGIAVLGGGTIKFDRDQWFIEDKVATGTWTLQKGWTVERIVYDTGVFANVKFNPQKTEGPVYNGKFSADIIGESLNPAWITLVLSNPNEGVSEDEDSGLTASTSILTRKVVVDWAGHPGAKLVLNNGALTDYLWGDEQGSWPPFSSVQRAWWKQSGSNNSRLINVKSYNHNVRPLAKKTGETTVKLSYIINDVTYPGSYTFNVEDEVQSVKIDQITHPQLEKKFLFAWGPYPESAEIGGQITGKIMRTWSETTETKNSTEAALKGELKIKGTVKGSIGVLSLEGGTETGFSSEVRKGIEKATGRSISDSKSTTVTGHFKLTLPAGKVLRWFSHIETDRYNLTVKYYEDMNPRDAFPDKGNIQMLNLIQTFPLGLGNSAYYVDDTP